MISIDVKFCSSSCLLLWKSISDSVKSCSLPIPWKVTQEKIRKPRMRNSAKQMERVVRNLLDPVCVVKGSYIKANGTAYITRFNNFEKFFLRRSHLPRKVVRLCYSSSSLFVSSFSCSSLRWKAASK